ncbi:rod shape-determining protein MreC [Sphingobacterium olei]|uniref:Cell shape-determining protein MreC n=1 Tax=Sphingobacterium olei TaxID=2571155 RepID=A0A4U0P5W5_9SPHI|nr:rod shape-determining protein MreC [Sphingobacterium olei]TJZ62783.1 rod shape-determining protein MreC [Sphingobacterium olei]
MKNLWLFLVRYNAFFWFILFFVLSILLIVRNNNFQRTSFVNSSSVVVGSFYEKVNSWKSYLALSSTNEQLALENAKLRQRLENYIGKDTLDGVKLVDSIDIDRYEFIVASVVNNSIHQKSNFLTLNKGSKDGVELGMGVITSNGVVGSVLNVSAHFSTVKSLLHPDTKISVTLDSTADAFGSLVWGNNTNSRYAMIRDIPNHIKVYTGQAVFTSGYSTLFPKGIKVGHIIESGITSGESFKDIRILLTTNFSNLSHVYIVKDRLAMEKIGLEATNKDNG